MCYKILATLRGFGVENSHSLNYLLTMLITSCVKRHSKEMLPLLPFYDVKISNITRSNNQKNAE